MGLAIWHPLERKISFLFVFARLFFRFFAICIFSFYSYFFRLIRIFSICLLLSAFFHPHPPSAGIWSAFYRHPHLSGEKRQKCLYQRATFEQRFRKVEQIQATFAEFWSTFLEILTNRCGCGYLGQPMWNLGTHVSWNCGSLQPDIAHWCCGADSCQNRSTGSFLEQ